MAKGVVADGVALEGGKEVGLLLVLVEEDVEVVQPEVGHDGFELAVGIDVTLETAAEGFGGDDALRALERGEGLLLLGAEAVGEAAEFVGGEGFSEGDEVRRRELKQAADARRWRQGEKGGRGCLGVEVVLVVIAGGLTSGELARGPWWWPDRRVRRRRASSDRRRRCRGSWGRGGQGGGGALIAVRRPRLLRLWGLPRRASWDRLWRRLPCGPGLRCRRRCCRRRWRGWWDRWAERDLRERRRG